MKINKVMTLMVIFGLFFVTLNAQYTWSKVNWIYHLGVNVVDDGGDRKLSNIFKGDNLNFGNPFIFGAEYFYNSEISFISNISFNKYIAGKNIDSGIILQNEEASYLSVDLATKYHFLQPLTSNIFEPYVFLGLGYTKIGDYETSVRKVPSVGRFTFNSGIGANYWLSNSVGLNLNVASKFGVKSEKYKDYISNQTQVSLGVFYAFNLNGDFYDSKWNRKKYRKKSVKPIILVAVIPEKCLQSLHITVVDAETRNPIPNANVSILKGGLLLKTIKTTTNVAYNFEIDCNNYYTIELSATNYEDASVVIKTSNIANQSTNKIISLKLLEELVTTRGQKMINTAPIYFELNSSYLNKEAKIELNKVVEIMKKYQNIVIEIGSHTDSRASAKYNSWLSERRAKSTIKYIVAHGISASRVSGKGYGESQLINKCSNGVRCSEAEHQLNRRTEFVIIND